jgi:O-methyltransferase
MIAQLIKRTYAEQWFTARGGRDCGDGLPDTSPEESNMRRVSGAANPFRKGCCASGLVEVRNNIRKAGVPSVCEYVPGYFCDSLPHVDVQPAMIFSDADLISSTREVIQYLWPRLRPG